MLYYNANVGSPIPGDVYERIQNLESRILQLESLSPEYFDMMVCLKLSLYSLKIWCHCLHAVIAKDLSSAPDHISQCYSFELCNYYYYTCLTASFSRTTWINQYRKGKTSLDLNEARDDGVLGCSGISCIICKQSASRSRQITTPTPHHSIFISQMLFVMPSQQCQSTEGTIFWVLQVLCIKIFLVNLIHVTYFCAN